MTDLNKPLMLVFAGPNGSGKSTVTEVAQDSIGFPSLYINADEIARKEKIGALEAAIEADKQRKNAIENRVSFAMETVMSTPEKTALMRLAKDKGYDVELIYVTTQNPAINVERVKTRVLTGGHDVPEEKTLSRYDRSMKLIPEAVEASTRAKIYNNSFENPVLIAEKTKNREIIIYPQPAPNRWSEKTIKDLIGVESAKVITPEFLNRIQEIKAFIPDPAHKLPPVELEYMRNAKTIINETGGWPGNKADNVITAHMLKQGYDVTSIRTTLEKASPNLAKVP